MSTTTKYSSKKITAPPKKEIEEYYNQYGVSISDVARKYNTSNPTVRKWMIEYGIKIQYGQRSQKEIELFEWCESLNEELMWVSNDRSVIP
jgi:transposase-like protein